MTSPTKTLVDTAVGGCLMRRTYEATYDLLAKMNANSYQWWTECNAPRRATRVHEANAYFDLIAKVDALPKQLKTMSAKAIYAPVV